MHCRFVLHTHVCIPITSFARFAVHQETCRFLDHRFFGAVCTMTKRVNSSFVPKKGKARQVMKKPAMVKTKPWQDVPYTPQERFGRSTWSSYRSNQVEVYTLRPFESRQRGHRQASGTGQTPHRHDRRHLSPDVEKARSPNSPSAKVTVGNTSAHHGTAVCGSTHITCTLCLWTDGATRLRLCRLSRHSYCFFCIEFLNQRFTC